MYEIQSRHSNMPTSYAKALKQNNLSTNAVCAAGVERKAAKGYAIGKAVGYERGFEEARQEGYNNTVFNKLQGFGNINPISNKF